MSGGRLDEKRGAACCRGDVIKIMFVHNHVEYVRRDGAIVSCSQMMRSITEHGGNIGEITLPLVDHASFVLLRHGLEDIREFNSMVPSVTRFKETCDYLMIDTGSLVDVYSALCSIHNEEEKDDRKSHYLTLCAIYMASCYRHLSEGAVSSHVYLRYIDLTSNMDASTADGERNQKEDQECSNSDMGKWLRISFEFSDPMSDPLYRYYRTRARLGQRAARVNGLILRRWELFGRGVRFTWIAATDV